MWGIKGERHIVPIMSVFVVILSVFTILYFGGGSITGHISAPIATQSINLNVIGDKSFLLAREDALPMDMSSLKVTGKVIGDGNAKLSLVGEGGEEFLIYSSKDIRERKLDIIPITGFFGAENEGTNISENISNVSEVEEVSSECSLDSECLEGICEGGVCLDAECFSNDDCDLGRQCKDNRCVIGQVEEGIDVEVVFPEVDDVLEENALVVARYDGKAVERIELYVDNALSSVINVEGDVGLGEFALDLSAYIEGEHELFVRAYGGLVVGESDTVPFRMEFKEEEEPELVVVSVEEVKNEEIKEVNELIEESVGEGDVEFFESECLETCFLYDSLDGSKSFYLRFEVDAGTVLTIDEITYS